MKTTLSVLLCLLLICSCKNDSGRHKRGSHEKYGGKVSLNEIENFKSLFPISINEITNYHIATQVYEGLVRYANDLSIIPAIARAWEVSEDLKTYTFHIRPEVYFHDDICFTDTLGRTVNSSDIKFCFEVLCTESAVNNQFNITFKDRVSGANEYYEKSRTDKGRQLKGVQTPDDSTVVITLEQPDANFLNVLAMPGCFIYPREAFLKYGVDMKTRTVGTGPFYIESLREGIEILMKRHERYWGTDEQGLQLPYLDTLHWSFILDKHSEVEAFREGRLDMIYNIPVEMFSDVFNKDGGTKKEIPFELYSSPALSTNYYGFNLQTNPFFSIREIRTAFNLAIDRKKLTNSSKLNDGTPAIYGIVPYTESFEKRGYDYKSIRGFEFDPDSARKLLASVGYEKGKGLPPFTLEINSGGGERNLMVAMQIQKMLLENIGVKVNLSIVNWPEHVENVQTGKVDFFRYAWVSDYADPESFLTLFYGKHLPENYLDRSYVNLVRFRNRAFDSLYEKARTEPDERKRYALYSKADQVILDEAAFIPLFYDDNLRLVQKHVKNLEENALNYVDLRTTWIVKAKAAARH